MKNISSVCSWGVHVRAAKDSPREDERSSACCQNSRERGVCPSTNEIPSNESIIPTANKLIVRTTPGNFIRDEDACSIAWASPYPSAGSILFDFVPCLYSRRSQMKGRYRCSATPSAYVKEGPVRSSFIISRERVSGSNALRAST